MKPIVAVVIMVWVVLVLLGAIAALVLIPKGNSPVPVTTTGNEADIGQQADELDPFCPSSLHISTFVITQGTKDKSDDEVWLSIINPDPRDYSARVFVNLALEIEDTLPADSKLEFKSKLMTAWWVSPVSDEEDAEVETIDITKTNSFSIDVRVRDCEKQIAILTPDSPLSASGASGVGEDSEDIGGGGGGGGGSIIQITRTEDQNIND